MTEDNIVYVNLECNPDIKHENYVNMIKNVCKSEKKSRQQEFENEVDYILSCPASLIELEKSKFIEKWSPK